MAGKRLLALCASILPRSTSTQRRCILFSYLLPPYPTSAYFSFVSDSYSFMRAEAAAKMDGVRINRFRNFTTQRREHCLTGTTFLPSSSLPKTEGGPLLQQLAPVTNTVRIGCLRFRSRLRHPVLSLHVDLFTGQAALP